MLQHFSPFLEFFQHFSKILHHFKKMLVLLAIFINILQNVATFSEMLEQDFFCLSSTSGHPPSCRGVQGRRHGWRVQGRRRG
jgi:hypothetical protein